jgi:hypothetical protein
MDTKVIKELINDLEDLNYLSATNESDKVILELSKRATAYLLSHPWCVDIVNGWLAISWNEEILGVFLYEIKSNIENFDQYIWMIVGDLPSVYIDIESATNPKDALSCYIDIMNDWVEAVNNNEHVEDCYPVEVPPTKENASMLKHRLNMLENYLNGEFDEID